jgi:predicted nicotinamide N-methyase
MGASTASSEASDIADFIADFEADSDDGGLHLDLLAPAQPDGQQGERHQQLQGASESAALDCRPEPEPEPAATTPHGVAAQLIDELGRRRSARSWMAACASLIALGGPAHPVVVEFKRLGGMRLLTGLLQASATNITDESDDLLDAATTAIASCSGTTARPQQRTFEINDGVAIQVQELPYEIAGTGHAVWSAAVLQARWLCMQRSELLRAEIRSALELGSGLGLSGLTLAKLGLPGLTVTLSDIVPAIVRNLLASAALNRTAAGQTLAVRACLCDWGAENDLEQAHSAHGWYGTDALPGAAVGGSSCSTMLGPSGSRTAPLGADDEAVADATVQMLPQGETFDLVLAADVLYEPDHPALLAGVLKQRLRPGGQFYAVCSIRQLALLADLLARLDELCEDVVVTAEDTGDLEASSCLPGLGCWTTQHSSSYVGGIQRITATRRAVHVDMPDAY